MPFLYPCKSLKIRALEIHMWMSEIVTDSKRQANAKQSPSNRQAITILLDSGVLKYILLMVNCYQHIKLDIYWEIAISIFLYISFGFLWISEFFLLYL